MPDLPEKREPDEADGPESAALFGDFEAAEGFSQDAKTQAAGAESLTARQRAAEAAMRRVMGTAREEAESQAIGLGRGRREAQDPEAKKHAAAARGGKAARRAAAPPASPAPAAGRALQEPPKRREGVTAWLVALLCMLAAAPAVLIDLYRPEVTDGGEAKALATSIHSWTRLNSPAAAGENFIESLVPRYNGRRQWRDAPGVTWTQMLAFQLIASKPAKAAELVATIDGQGRLAMPPPFEAIQAAGLTAARLDDAIALQGSQKHKFIDVKVGVAPGSPAAGDAAVKPTFDEQRLLAPGDVVRVEVGYVEPNWREQVDTIDLIKFGRLGSALLGLITIAAVFWAGHSIAGMRAGLYSALICAANPVFIWHARLASPPIHQAMWAMLSIAAALWAIRPLRASPSVERQFLGWVVCGLSLGGAALATGPLIVVTVMGPIVLLLLLCPNRRGHFMGLMAAVIIGFLVALPWTAKIFENDPDAWATWWREHQPFGFNSIAILFDMFGDRLLLILAALMPWSVWLVAAIAQPMSTSSAGSRTRLFLGFAWFMAAALIMLMLPATDHIGALLPLVPAAAVMIGQLFHHYADLAGEARYARFWRVLRWPHVLLLVAVSVLTPLLISWPQPFIDSGWFSSAFFFDLGWAFSAGFGLVLFVLVAMAAREAHRQYPAGMLGYTAAWMLLLATVIAIPASRSPHAASLIRKDADVLIRSVQKQPVYAVQGEAFSPGELSPVVLLYAGRKIQTIAAKEIDEVSTKDKTTIFLLSRADASKPAERAEAVTSLPHTKMRLWKLEQKPEGPVAGQ